MKTAAPAPAAPARPAFSAPKMGTFRPVAGAHAVARQGHSKGTLEVAPSEPSAPTEAAPPAALASPASALSVPTGSLLHRVRADSAARTAVTKAVEDVFAAHGGDEPAYSPEQFMEDWPAAPDENDWHPDSGAEYYAAGAHVIRQACARLNQLFAAHLSELAVGQAPTPVIREVGLIVKLTFARVKEAPGAWDMLDLADRATIIKGMRHMTMGRHEQAVTRKPRDAAAVSAGVEALLGAAMAEDDSVRDAIAGISFDIDLGGL